MTRSDKDLNIFIILIVVLSAGATAALALIFDDPPPPPRDPALVLCVEGKSRDHCLALKARWRR